MPGPKRRQVQVPLHDPHRAAEVLCEAMAPDVLDALVGLLLGGLEPGDVLVERS